MPKVTTEFYIDGAWTDTAGGESISDRVRQSDGVRITRGQVDQQSGISAQQSTFTLNNRDGLLSGRNPGGALFGKLTRNTRIRQGVKAADGTWEPYLLLPRLSGYGAFTSDKASLDITGDLDVRVDITPENWRGTNWTVMGKYSTAGDQRSWLLRVGQDGDIRFSWTTAGTFATISTYASDPVPVGTGRLAIRVTIDVDNGAGGHTVNWYTAPDIDSAWTLLDTQTGAGVTSIFASTVELEVGSANGGGGAISDSSAMAGKVHAAQLYNGIGGTLVADFRPDEQTDLDATGWTDTCASPNGWTFGTSRSPRLASDRIRFCGEIVSLPQRWDSTGRDVFIPAQAFGVLRRLSTNSSPIGSAIYRNYRNYPDIIGYWTMEDEAGASQAANATSGAPPGLISNCTFGGATGLDGSAGALTLTGAGSRVQLRTKAVTTTPTVCNLIFYFRLSNLPASAATFLSVQGTGIIRRFDVRVGTTTFEFKGYGVDGTEHISRSTTFGSGVNPTTGWVGMQLKITQSGSNLLFENSWHAVGTENFYTTDVGGFLLLTPTGGIGRFGTATFSTAADSAFHGAQIAHVINAVEDLDFVTVRFRDASKAYAGETAAARMARFCTEEGIFFEVMGVPDETETVGPQPIGKPADILSGAAAVDGGILGEVRDKLGLRYVTRRQLGWARPFEVAYSDSILDMTPEAVEDDRYIQNDVTVTRPSGSSGRHVVEDGPLSVQDPPDGVGRYERSISLSAAADEQLDPLAQWQAHLGSWDEYRVPTLSFNLSRSEVSAVPGLEYNLLALDWGDGCTVTDLPAFLPPDDLALLSFGYTEEINKFVQRIVHNTVPFGPWRNWHLNNGTDEPRLDATDHSLDGAVTAGATSIDIKAPVTLRAPKFIDSTNFPAEFPAGGGPPVYIRLEGEKVEVTACTVGSSSGGYWRQTLTVTRSINGVSKAHADGTQLRLWDYAWGTL